MRPHRLTLTAFGSFPGTETVDFDALSAAGLFLVHGPTGAGKTTILDALCFALYGQVPGQRNSARSLRCDHAPPSVGPSVTLEVTIRGRLLRIQRSPAWLRPKLRGSGVTEEKSKVVLSEWQGGDWHGLTTRLDEAGDLVGGLLGMNADQFCQVAMLPQGDFARFLRADGDERSKLLERLFTVKIFTSAESWLAEHRKLAWREAQELRQEVDFAVKRVEEAAGDDLAAALTAAPAEAVPASAGLAASGPAASGPAASASKVPAPATPAGPRADHLAPPALFDLPAPVQPSPSVGGSSEEGGGTGDEVPTPESDPVRWAGALLDAARAVVRRAEEEHAAAGQELRAARTRFERAAALAERQRRHAEALTLRRTLDERADERADLQAILDDAARADRVIPLITAARQRAEAATKARTLAADALARARPLLSTPGPARDQNVTVPPAHIPGQDFAASPAHGSGSAEERDTGRSSAYLSGEPSVAELAGLERRRQDEIARLSELLTEEARLSVVRRDLLRVEQELAELVRADEAVAARLAVLPGLIEQAEARLAEARVDAARIPAARAVRDAAAHLIEIDGELARLAVELDTLAQREAEVAAADAELPGRLADASAALAEVRAEAAAIPAASAGLDAARAALEAAHRREALAAELEAAVGRAPGARGPGTGVPRTLARPAAGPHRRHGGRAGARPVRRAALRGLRLRAPPRPGRPRPRVLPRPTTSRRPRAPTRPPWPSARPPSGRSRRWSPGTPTRSRPPAGWTWRRQGVRWRWPSRRCPASRRWPTASPPWRPRSNASRTSANGSATSPGRSPRPSPPTAPTTATWSPNAPASTPSSPRRRHP
ncbi:hypothetical protein GCM10020220_062520 [Nonomuraea rubra]|uniref:AAA family ATPase n=1 Tax=Nonomuraea rubra TaxID=46180 RepID=UPI0031F19E41